MAAITSEQRDRIRAHIVKWLAQDTPGAKVDDLRKMFPEVSSSTFFRILREAKRSPPIIMRAADEARALVGESGRENALPEDATPQARVVAAMMPTPVSPVAIRHLPGVNAVELLHECIALGREVIAYCRGADGKIRNFKGALTASSHMRASVDTLARVVERVNDAQRINEVLDMIIAEIGKESPDAAQRILARIQTILQATGL